MKLELVVQSGSSGSWSKKLIRGNVHEVPSKHAGSDFEVFWLWPVMAIMANMQPDPVLHSMIWAFFGRTEPNQMWKVGSNIYLYCAKLDLIWMVWSGFSQMHLVQRQAGV